MKIDNIDKSSWKTITFGEVAIQQKENVDIETTKLNKYIAGEHMASEDLHIRQWGIVGDGYLGPAFIRKFQKGDILYGSRRTYLKKVTVADFDGITSNTTFVIKANSKNIVPELLPFIMLSDNFTEHSIKHSKGSVNPYINWKDIANYEFLFPSKEEQACLAELLWAADEVVERNLEVKEKLEFAFYRKRIELLGHCINGRYFDETKKHIRISNILLNDKSNVGKVDTTEYLSKGEIPIIDQSSNEIAGYSNRKELVYSGSLPVIIFGDHTINVKYIDYPFILGADGTKILCTNETINCKYLYYCIKNLSLIPQGYRRHFSILRECNIPFLPMYEQQKVVKILDTYEGQIKNIEKHIIRTQQLKSTLINQIF